MSVLSRASAVLAWVWQWLATIWLGEVLLVVVAGGLIWLVSWIRTNRNKG